MIARAVEIDERTQNLMRRNGGRAKPDTPNRYQEEQDAKHAEPEDTAALPSAFRARSAHGAIGMYFSIVSRTLCAEAIPWNPIQVARSIR